MIASRNIAFRYAGLVYHLAVKSCETALPIHEYLPYLLIAVFILGCLLIGCTSFIGLAILFSTGPARRG